LILLQDHKLRNQFGVRAMRVADTFPTDIIGGQWSDLVESVYLRKVCKTRSFKTVG
jgi:hypothetical protein